jgi:hypothetical protein
MSKRNEYIAKMKMQLDELNATMNRLDAKTDATKADVRDMYLEEMRKLRHQSKLASARLEEVKASSEDSWQAMVAEMDKVKDAFRHSFNYFKSQF